MARILLIDDEQAVRSVIRRAMERVGHTVVEAVNGRNALEVLDDGFDLVITDVIMPEMDGIELILALAERDPELPVLAISGGGIHMPKELLLENADHLGVVTTLPKPFELTQLEDAVDEALTQEWRPEA